MNQPTRSQQIVDLQLPLPWLISSAVAVLMALAAMIWSIAGQSNKLDQLILNTAKLEKRVDERDNRVDLIKESQYEARRVLDAHGMRIDALERAARK